MSNTLIQLGLTDRPALADARRDAGGEAPLADNLRRVTRMSMGVEPVVLSTCERLELYAIVPDARRAKVAAIAGLIAGNAGAARLETRIGSAAVSHLFSIAAGLESRLVGEPHVLGQVSRCIPSRCAIDDAANLPVHAGFRVMQRLIQDAVACGRAARAASGLDRLAVSCVDLAVAHAARSVPRGASAAVVGRGMIAREIAPRLADIGLEVTLFSRHAPLDGDHRLDGIPWSPLASLREHAARLSLVIAATSAMTPIVSRSDIGARDAWLDMIDLGFPPNIATDLAEAPRVRIASLETLLEGHRAPREAVEAAQAIVRARASRWSRRWIDSDDTLRRTAEPWSQTT